MEDKFYKVEGHSSLIKNPKTGTILNTNVNEIKSARKRKQIRARNKVEDQQLKDDVQSLKNEMAELKSLIKQLVEK